MSKPKIAVILGTTRPTRFGDKPANWIYNIAAEREDLDVELLDLRDYPLPFFDEVASNAWAPSKDPAAVAWQQKLAEFDGYIFVTPEYNHSITGVLKNAIDQAYVEWVRKPAAIVAYGMVGGARAAEQLRLILVELQMAPTRFAVHIQGADFMAAMQGKSLHEIEHLQGSARTMLDDLAWWTNALKAAREGQAAAEQELAAA